MFINWFHFILKNQMTMATISYCTYEDLNQIMVIDHELFSQPFHLEDYEIMLDNPQQYHCLKLEEYGEIVAFAAIVIMFDEANLLTIGTVKKAQKRGYGRHLLNSLINLCKNNDVSILVLEVRQSNRIAQDLYKSVGFKINRIRPNYYPEEDGLEMILELEAS